jgi:hypothetical protein
MRIPIFRSEAQATNEAPGSSIQARMNAQPFVQAALAKGEVFAEATKQIGSYALMRAKADAEVQYNEAMLAADEEMRMLADDLKKNGRLEDVESENGAWRAKSKDIRDRLADGLSSRSMTSEFSARFNQQELSLRFQLRDSIQARIERDIARARAAKMQRAEDDIANGTDIAGVNLIFTGIGANTDYLANNGLANPSALKAEEYALVVRATERAAIKYLEEQNLSIGAASRMHEALRSDDPSKIPDARGLYVYSLMQKLDPLDRVALLKKLNGTSEYVNGATLEEERFSVVSKQVAEDLGSSITSSIDLLSDGGEVPEAQLAQIEATIESVKGSITPETALSLQQSYSSLVELKQLTTEVRPLNQRQLDEMIQGIGQPQNEVQQRNLDFLTKYRDNRNRGLKEDPLGWAFESGFSNQSVIDLSPDAINSGTTNIEQRIAAGQNLRAQFNLDHVPVFTNAEVAEITGRLLSEEPIRGVTSLSNLRSILGPGGNYAVEQMRRAGLPLEYAIAIDVQDPALRQTVAALASTSFQELSEQTDQTNIREMDSKVREMLAPYMSAYLTGGDGQAVKLLNEEVEIARKIAASQIVSRKMSPLEAAEYAVQNFFPEYDRVVQNNHGNFIVPTQFDVDQLDDMTEQLLDPDALRAAGIEPISGASFFLPDGNETVLSEEIAGDITSSIESGVSIAALADNGVWLNNSRGDGVVLHYNLNGQYLPVRLKTGGVYDVKFAEMGGLTSRLAPPEEIVGGRGGVMRRGQSAPTE